MNYNNTKIQSNNNNGNYINKEKEALDLIASAKEKVPSLLSSERYKQFLAFFPRLHRYSFINIILVFYQYPQMTYLAGFNTWQKYCLSIWNDPARQILKQEYKGKPIRLLAPWTVVSGGERKLINYVVPVYDSLQTNDIPPLEQHPEFVLHPRLKNLLSAVRFCSPYRIIVAGRENLILQNGLSGYCDHINKLIVLNEELKNETLLAETVRQLVAAELEKKEYDSEVYSELIIESVLYIFNQYFGCCINSEVNNFGFVSRYKDGSIDDLATVLHIIQQTSHKLIEDVESFLSEVDEYESYAWLDEEILLDFDIR